jgi:hypothetical protein
VEITTVKLPKSGNADIYLSSCQHYGALNCSRSSIRQMVEDVGSTAEARLILLGDMIDAITPNDKRWQTTSVDWKDRLITPQDQAKMLVTEFSPIKRQIPIVLTGNHEWALSNVIDLPKDVAEKLGAFYGSASCVAHFEWKGKTAFRFFLQHGGWTPMSNAKDPVQADANMRAMLKLKLQDQVGDCVGMFTGHGHRLLIQRPTAHEQLYITTTKEGGISQHYKVSPRQDAEYIHPDCRFYGMCGTFLKLHSPPGSKAVSYAEMKSYKPVEIGCLKAIIREGQMVNLEKVVY